MNVGTSKAEHARGHHQPYLLAPRQLKLASYDRLFPEGAVRTWVQHVWRRRSAPVPGSMAFWRSWRRYSTMAQHDIEPTILHATGGAHPLDVTFIDDEELATPWKRDSLTHCHPRRRASCWPRANWSAKASIIRRLTCWYRPCRSCGRAVAAIRRPPAPKSTPARTTCASSTSWTPATQRCCGCGTSDSAATERGKPNGDQS
jgi:hypothetical protein